MLRDEYMTLMAVRWSVTQRTPVDLREPQVTTNSMLERARKLHEMANSELRDLHA